jgi:ABC-type transport system involved in multi-copper enzyme maturation permease subunit
VKIFSWFRRNIGSYTDNPTSRRDYRSQLRSNKSAILWGFYLLVLIAVATLNYSVSADVGSVSVVRAQSELQNFYTLVMYMLGAMVCLIAPALGATTVIAERERRSLDLIFSAPVRPKMFLVGKMISAFRYTWMLLVLAMPVTAVSVVLGGATWSDVLIAYVLLSLSGLVLSSIALLFSTIAPKAVSAITWSYAAVGLYILITFGFASSFGMVGSRGMGGPPGVMAGEVPFLIGLSPFSVTVAADTHTMMFGIEVPNWILVAIFSLLTVRFFLLCAGSALSPYGSAETKNLRISGLAYTFLLTFGLTYSLYSVMPGSATTNVDAYAAGAVGWIPLFFLLFAPFVCCFGEDAERKFMYDGVFSLKGAFRGTPSGGLPYLLMLVLAIGIGVILAFKMLPITSAPGEHFVSTLYWAFGFWIFVWGLGRWTSAATSDLRSARILHVAFLLMILGLPVPFLSLISSGGSESLWHLYPLSNLTNFQAYENLLLRFAMGTALSIVGVVFAGAAERKRKVKTGVLASAA